MTSDAVVKSVGKKLRYYFEVKRLEDGFDLSGVGQPTLDHPRLKPRKTLQCDVQPDVPLKYHFKSPSIRVKLTQFPGYKAPTSSRERRVKKILENYVTKSEFMHPFNPWKPTRKMPYMSNYSYVNTSKGRKMRSDASCVLKSGKKRPIKGSYPVLRSVHPHFVTKKQADRMVTVASKLLVASETVQDIKPKHQGHSPHDRQAAPSPFETERQLPHIEPQSRPKTSRGFHGKRHSEDGRDSAYTTDRASPGSEEYQRRDGQGRLLSPHSSDSDADRSPHPPLNGRPPGRRRPPSARTRRQMQVSDISHPAGGQVGVELAVQTRDSVGSQTDNRGGLDERMVRSGSPVDYVIYVRTGKRIGASTKADVKITLYGELGRSQEFLLAESRRHKIKFQKGHEDLFTLHSPHVGRLKCVKIGHDRPELMFAWFLEGVTVEDRMDRRVYECPCERWLSGQDGDKQTYRILPVDRDRALLDDSEDDNSSDVSYIKKYGQETGSEGDRSPRNSPESVRARRSQKTSHISESETETETESDSETASSEASPREVAMKPPLTDKKAAQTHQYKPTQANRAEEKPEVSPGRKMKDDFFDQRPAGPVYTFRPATSVSSQEDVHKPELSDSDTATSRTYTSDNTESNSAAVIPPRATYPVIAEEKVVQQETVKVARPRPESRQSNSITNMPKKSVPLIAVQESAEPPIDSTPANSTSQVHFSTSESLTENSSVLIGVSNIDSKAGPSSLLGVSNSGPKIDRTRSGSSTDRSGSTTDRSGSGTDRTGSGTDRTVSGTDRTGSSTDRTEPGTNRTASGTDQTGSGTDRTGSGTDRTGSGTDRTGSSTDRTVSGSGTTVDRTISDKVTESNTKTVEPSPVSKPEQGASGMSNRQVVNRYEQQTERRSSYSDSGSSTADSDSESSGTSDSESDSVTDATTPRSQKDTLEMTREAYKAELGGESIHQAAKTGNLTKVKEIVENSAESISSVNEVGWTPLHIAASEGQLDVVRWLVSAGVSLNTDTPTGYTALHLAALHGHLNTIMELSSLGAAVNCRTTDRQTPLHLAARSGDISCVKWLVGNRASVGVRDESGRTPRDLAEENEHDDVAHFLRQCEQDGVAEVNSSYSRTGVSSVPSSAEKIETSVLEKTSSDQASVTVHEEESEAIVTSSVESPTHHRHQSIHDAAKRGNLPRVEEIVREHPDKKNSVNEVGWTPLHIAAAEGRLDVVKWLVSSEVDLNTETPTGYTAMHLAALHGHAHNLKMLASRGATVDCITTDGQTPLHLASMNGDLSCVKWLVGNRASVLSRDEAGRTPRDLAEENEHDDVAYFLSQCEQDTGVKATGSDDQNGGYELPPIEEDVVTRDMNFSANPKGTTDDASSEDSVRPVTPGRSQEDLEEKRQLYSEQQIKKEESGLSFLDMIRQETDNGS